MDTPIRDKKTAFVFSLTDAEKQRIESRVKAHGFRDRNLYLLALVAADEELKLSTISEGSENAA